MWSSSTPTVIAQTRIAVQPAEVHQGELPAMGPGRGGHTRDRVGSACALAWGASCVDAISYAASQA